MIGWCGYLGFCYRQQKASDNQRVSSVQKVDVDTDVVSGSFNKQVAVLEGGEGRAWTSIDHDASRSRVLDKVDPLRREKEMRIGYTSWLVRWTWESKSFG